MTSGTDRRPTRLAYRPDLDGVRALAVLAVLGFHANYHQRVLWSIFGGGFLGVDIFFVLSGMLITQLLLSEWSHRGTVSLRAFYERRSRRLLPALAVMLAVYCTFSTFVHHDLRALLRGLYAELVYENTAHLVAPYPLAIGQTWTLIVEWEFYFVWPVVMIWMLRRRSPRDLLWLTAALVVADAALRAGIYAMHQNFILTYHVGWLRIDELLIGSLAAQLAARFGARLRVPGWLRTLGLVVLLVSISRGAANQAWLYLGGMSLIAVGTAAVVAPYDDGHDWWGRRLLSSGPLPWIGRISYSLYLWSVPVAIEILRDTNSWAKPLRTLTAVVGGFALASLSYYAVERVFRHDSRKALQPASDDGMDERSAVGYAHAAESSAL